MAFSNCPLDYTKNPSFFCPCLSGLPYLLCLNLQGIRFGCLHLPLLNSDHWLPKLEGVWGRLLGHEESCCGWPSRWAEGKVLFFLNLNDTLILQHKVFTHFLRIVFHTQTPDQSIFKFFDKIFVNLHAEILHNDPGVRQHHWGCIICQQALGFYVNPP